MKKKEQLFVLLNLMDFCTTNLLLSLDGEEVMPISATVIEALGMPGLFSYKVITSLAVIYALRLFKAKDSLWDLLNGAFTGVIIWNNVGVFLTALFSTTC